MKAGDILFHRYSFPKKLIAKSRKWTEAWDR